MKDSAVRIQILKFAFRGLVLGMLFPLFAWILTTIYYNQVFSISTLIQFAFYNPFGWLSNLVPIAAVIMSYNYGKSLILSTLNAQTSYEAEQNKNKKIFEFTEKLRLGDIDAEFDIEQQNDELGQALIMLRNQLRLNREEENQRKKEDNQRNWTTEGLAKFSDLLRQTTDINKLSYLIISNLVKYLNATQGGFYILQQPSNHPPYFELTGSFAYDRKKFCDQRIEWGEGLIGAAALEKSSISLNEVTEGYVQVTSGLGKANPRCILIVPMLINEELQGVIEFASFKNFEPFETEFVEKIAESIASTLASININTRTALLLHESQAQAQTLALQEEEMRRNMNELKEIQSEKAKQSEQFVSFTNSVNHTLIRAEYDTSGILLYANTNFLEKLEYHGSEEVLGKHISIFINKKDKEWFNPIWDKLASGGRHFEGDMKHVTKRGRDLWTMATYTCVRTTTGGVEKVLFIAIDTTQQKKESLDYKGQIDALNNSLIKAELELDGSFINANNNCLATLHYSASEIFGKQFLQLFEANDRLTMKKAWENMLGHIPYHGRAPVRTSGGTVTWLNLTLSAVDDMYGEISKVILIAYDITKQVEVENQIREQTLKLREQEEKLQQSQVELSRKLKEAREEMKLQFREIERVKILNEKTLEGMLDAIVTINGEGKVEFFNKAAEQMWGFEKFEILGKTIEAIVPNEPGLQRDNYIGNYFKTGTMRLINKRIEVFLINSIGEEVNVLLTLSESKYDSEYRLTAFIQNIEVELF